MGVNSVSATNTGETNQSPPPCNKKVCLMKIARFLWRNKVRWGSIEGDQVYAIRIDRANSDRPNAGKIMRSIYDARNDQFVTPRLTPELLCHISEIRLLAPIDPRYNKVVAIAANYGERDGRDGPGIFMKQPGTIIGPDDLIIYPRTGISVLHEAELGVAIGRFTKNVSVDDSPNYILGYTCVNDVSGAKFTADDTGRGLSMRWKHFDTFCPVGPWIDTDRDAGLRGSMFSGRSPEPYLVDNYDQFIKENSTNIQCRVNGETVVDGHTGQMLWNVPELISWVSEVMTLYPGDIIATGCPGVGEINVGDTVEVEVESVGTLRNFVVADTAEPSREWPALIN